MTFATFCAPCDAGDCANCDPGNVREGLIGGGGVSAITTLREPSASGRGSLVAPTNGCLLSASRRVRTMSDQHKRTRTPAGAIPDCYSCGGTGLVIGFGHTGECCPCLDAPDER